MRYNIGVRLALLLGTPALLSLFDGVPRAPIQFRNVAANAGIDYVVALRHLEAAANLDPKHRAIRLSLARAYRIAGRAADQARELRAYRELEDLKTPSVR